MHARLLLLLQPTHSSIHPLRLILLPHTTRRTKLILDALQPLFKLAL
jgi:hypothetical protein